jgi:sugar/nucleoside kinase (ribokinase family)
VNTSSTAPDFLSIGHVTHDLVEDGIQLGGAALYSALTAHHLGKKTSLLTSYGEDFVGKETLDVLATRAIPAGETSTFRNLYEHDRRVQYVDRIAGFLDHDALPVEWSKAGIVYVCPVLHEVSNEIGGWFSGSLLGVSPQGWMREWDKAGRIRPERWEGFEGLLRCARVVIVSAQDIEGNKDLVQDLRRFTPIVIVTRAKEGAVVYAPGQKLTLGTYSAEERDPTGAGDCFGAAFLVRYAETGDVEEAGRFASCVGSFVVEGAGIAGIPTRQDVEARMKRQVVPCKRG